MLDLELIDTDELPVLLRDTTDKLRVAVQRAQASATPAEAQAARQELDEAREAGMDALVAVRRAFVDLQRERDATSDQRTRERVWHDLVNLDHAIDQLEDSLSAAAIAARELNHGRTA